MPAEILIPDPITIPDISFSRSQAGLFDIKFEVGLPLAA
jgi:hypothetical protein